MRVSALTISIGHRLDGYNCLFKPEWYSKKYGYWFSFIFPFFSSRLPRCLKSDNSPCILAIHKYNECFQNLNKKIIQSRSIDCVLFYVFSSQINSFITWIVNKISKHNIVVFSVLKVSKYRGTISIFLTTYAVTKDQQKYLM